MGHHLANMLRPCHRGSKGSWAIFIFIVEQTLLSFAGGLLLAQLLLMLAQLVSNDSNFKSRCLMETIFKLS